MSSYTEEDLDAIFAKGIPQPGNDPNVWRKDRGGEWICRSKYGDTTPCGYGWEVDHICPKEQLKELAVPENRWDDMVNLRPMNAKNNVAKGEDYPEYTVTVQYNDDNKNPNNKEVKDKTKSVAKTVQDQIRKNYSEWWST